VRQNHAGSSTEATWIRVAIIAALVVVPLVLFFDVLFLDKALVTSSQKLMYPWTFGESPETVLAERSFRWDPTLNYFPRRDLTHESLMRGELPLWNPHSAGGMPLLADFQSAVYYPVNLVLNLGDPLRAMGWAVFLHVVLAGLGTYGFLRFRTLPAVAAGFGGLAYMMSGFLMTRIGHPTMVQAAAWLPWLFLIVDRIVVRGEARWFAALAAAAACSILSGFPQVTAHAFAASLLYFIYRGCSARIGSRPYLWAAAFASVGVGLAAVQIIPTLEFARQSGRMAEAISAEVWRTPAVSFLGLLVPGITGNPVEGTLWLAAFKGTATHPNDIGLVAYVGVLPLVFGLLAFARFRQDGEVRFLSGLAVLAVVGSMSSSVFSALYLFLPGAGAAQADRLAFLLSFCLAVLGAKGFAAVSAGTLRQSRSFFAGSLAVIGVLLGFVGALALLGRRTLAHVAGALSPPLSSGLWDRALSPKVREFLARDLDGWFRYELGQLRWPVLLLLAALLLVVLWRSGRGGRWLRWVAVGVTGLDLLLFAGAYYTPQPIAGFLEETPGIRFLQEERREPSRIVRAFSDAVLAANLNAVLGIDDAQGYNALMVDHYGRLFDLAARGTYVQNKKIDAPSDPGAFASPVFDLLNVEYVVMEGNPEWMKDLEAHPRFSDGGLERVFARDLVIYRNEDFLPRALWLPGPRFHESEELVTAGIASSGFDPSRSVLLEGDPGNVPWWSAAGGGGGRARLVSHEDLSVVVETSSEHPGWVRWAEADYPGWRVKVDGAEVLSWRSDLALRAIPVPGGRHEIEMTMDPVSTRLGLGLTLFSTVVLVLLSQVVQPRRGET